jgi:hypothetical protein
MTYFCCDIIGTITGSKKIDQRMDELIDFTETLKIINNKLDNIMYFSLFSTNDLLTVQNFVNELKPYLNYYNILNDKNFADKFMLEKEQVKILNKTEQDKVWQIIYSLKCYQHEKIKVNKIIYADDNYLNCQIIKEVISLLYPDIEIVIIIPGLKENNKQFYSDYHKEIMGTTLALKKYEATLNQNKNKQLLK